MYHRVIAKGHHRWLMKVSWEPVGVLCMNRVETRMRMWVWVWRVRRVRMLVSVEVVRMRGVTEVWVHHWSHVPVQWRTMSHRRIPVIVNAENATIEIVVVKHVYKGK